MKNYTIGYVDHDQAVHQRQLGPSIAALRGQFDVLSTNSDKCPATNYNTMLGLCTTPYLILTHQDVTFSPDLLECIDRTIAAVPDFGALGMVGVDKQHQYHWSTPQRIATLDTADCCFLVLRKDLGARFDDVTFDELHQYVEDYCGQVNRIYGKLCHTILIQAAQLSASMQYPGDVGYGFLRHHGFTWNQRGSCWGKWPEYRRRLEAKWPGLKTT